MGITRFSSIEHLNSEAIAALVDGELPRRAEHRAKVHLVHCAECREEVKAQRQASTILRENNASLDNLHASPRLMDKLCSIPQACDGQKNVSTTLSSSSISIDGRRHPESLIDAVDLVLRRIHRMTSKDSTSKDEKRGDTEHHV